MVGWVMFCYSSAPLSRSNRAARADNQALAESRHSCGLRRFAISAAIARLALPRNSRIACTGSKTIVFRALHPSVRIHSGSGSSIVSTTGARGEIGSGQAGCSPQDVKAVTE
jgi:hypothetical protein